MFLLSEIQQRRLTLKLCLNKTTILFYMFSFFICKIKKECLRTKRTVLKIVKLFYP